MTAHTDQTTVTGLRITPDGAIERITLHYIHGTLLRALCAAIDCHNVDVVGLDYAVDMWLDDEGLYTAEPNPAATMLADQLLPGGARQMYHGAAVFLGVNHDTGESVDLPGIHD